MTTIARESTLPEPARQRVATLLAGVVLLLLVVCAYANSVRGVFLFDDSVHILRNPRIGDLSDWRRVLSGTRPVVDLTLAINHAIGEWNVTGFHIVNIAVHALAAVTLFGLIRRTMMLIAGPRRSDGASVWLPLAAAAVWALHPLQTQSVTYVIQRAESLMGLFYLLTLYGVVRGARSSRPACWYIVAVAACALGMGSKAVMVTAPLVTLLYDRQFLAGSLSAALRKRWGLYLALFGTWGIQWFVGITPRALNPSIAGAHVGLSYPGTTPLQYALTQLGVLTTYLKLAVWPRPLCLDYTWPVARTIGAVAPFALLILPLATVTAWALWKRTVAGFLGACFFLFLAPTSSVVPIKDALFEHRMYLPLASLTVLAVVAGHAALSRLAACTSSVARNRVRIAAVMMCTALLALVPGTIRRNRVYASAEAMWRDVVATRPDNARGFENLGSVLAAEGRKAGATRWYQRAITIDPDFVSARVNLANALFETGRAADAVPHYRKALQGDPNNVQAWVALGHALEMVGQPDAGLEALRAAARVPPARTSATDLARAHFNLGSALGRQGAVDGAAAEFRNAIALWPDYEKAHDLLGRVLLSQGRTREAIKHLDRALAINPNNEAVRQARAQAASRQRKTPNGAGP